MSDAGSVDNDCPARMLTPELTEAAAEVARLLAERRLKLVLAESCTAGLAAAALGGVPGISNWFCGSAVVYRTETKSVWMGVNPPGFEPAEMDCVGPRTSKELAKAVLARTPEAEIAAAITGHLGPNAPAELDGRCFATVRDVGREESIDWTLSAGTGAPEAVRWNRQLTATVQFLRLIGGFLHSEAS